MAVMGGPATLKYGRRNAPVIDALLDLAVILLPAALSVAGVFVSMKAPHSKHHRAWRISLILVGVSISILTYWQQARLREAHESEIATLTTRISNLTSHITEVKRLLVNVRQEEEQNTAKREQAERDLAIIVQNTGKSTRAAVASDIKNTPIKIELRGQKTSDPAREERLASMLGRMAEHGTQIQSAFESTGDTERLKKSWSTWVSKTSGWLAASLNASYAIQFKNAQGSAWMGCPSGKSMEGCGYWQDIQAKKTVLMNVITDIRSGR